MIAGYSDGGDAPDKPLELVAGAADEAHTFLKQHPATLARFERVAKLVEGFESSFGMELLATVHWVLVRDNADPGTVIDAVHAWNVRKQMFTDQQIDIAAKRLAAEGWVHE
jgi:hypothetical protein